MGKVLICRRGRSQQELQALQGLAIGAGATSSDIEFIDEVAAAEADCASDVFLFLLTGALDENLPRDLTKSADGGRRAICVWPEGAADAPPPPGVKTKSYSIVCWSAERLRTAMADDDVICMDTASGDVLAADEPEHLECPK